MKTHYQNPAIAKLRKLTLPALLLATALTLNVTAHAGVLYGNAITATNPSAENPFNTGETTDFTADISLANSTLTRGSGLTAASAANRFSASNFGTALDTTKYFAFTVAPVDGSTLTFTSITGNYQVSATGPTTYALRSSLDGFATDITTGSLARTAVATAFNFDVSGAAFSAITTPITFELFEYGGTSLTGTSSINDFSIIGQVPEPSTVLGGVLLISAAAWSQRRHLRSLVAA